MGAVTEECGVVGMKSTVLTFVSSTCPHCPNAVRVAEQVEKELGGREEIKFRKIRVKTGEGKELSSRFLVKSLPTLILLNDGGEEVERMVGAPDKQKLKNAVLKAAGLKKPFFSSILEKLGV